MTIEAPLDDANAALLARFDWQLSELDSLIGVPGDLMSRGQASILCR